ncbi:hypothetical protein OG780_19265 [Streptomyces sp. NBC_00386]|uniref:DUF6907 domain-containing protein n=1 Tax=Streptomyces sp. NBC_00386 TaxID=2975734 RepID=UPI002E1CB3B9
MNSTVAATPTVKPGYRLMPATVGRTNATSVTVYIECPTWCTEDHVDEPVRDIEDVMHRGDIAAVYVPTFGYGAYPIQMHATVESDPVATEPEFKAAHITVQDAGGNSYSHLTPEMAERLADEVVGFAAQLRHQARTCRLANQVTGDSDPDMDEALRRVRLGASVQSSDIEAMPIDRLLKAFGVTVTEADGNGAELFGEPGAMEFRVGRATRQQLRDSEARRLLAEYAAGARRA